MRRMLLCLGMIVFTLGACEGRGRVHVGNNTTLDMNQMDMSVDMLASTRDMAWDLTTTQDMFMGDMSMDMVLDMGTMPDMDEDMRMSVLPCDGRFSFEPATLQTGSILTVNFKDTTGWTYIGFDFSGPGQLKGNDVKHVSKSSPSHWFSKFTLSKGGIYTISFFGDEPKKTIATCQVSVQDTGPPPPIDNPPQGDCTNKVCGDSDGAGGKCQQCPMIGSCLDPASPIGPSGPGPWSCLDNAGCVEDAGKCVIWCPGEPCLYEGGCPQGVESCLVDAGAFPSYEAACASCCRSRYHNRPGSPGHGQYACWDDRYNICRYPGDCTKPYPQ